VAAGTQSGHFSNHPPRHELQHWTSPKTNHPRVAPGRSRPSILTRITAKQRRPRGVECQFKLLVGVWAAGRTCGSAHLILPFSACLGRQEVNSSGRRTGIANSLSRCETPIQALQTRSGFADWRKSKGQRIKAT
jgi:hypothetical protein